MEILYTITVVMAFVIAAILFRALTRQTMRAERAEAALARIEQAIVSIVAEHAVAEALG